MKLKFNGVLLTALSKPYDFDGKKGVSHKIRAMIEGEIYSLKATEEQIIAMKQYEGEDGTFTLNLKSPKENLALDFESFVV